MTTLLTASLTFWSQGGAGRDDPLLTVPQDDPAAMAFMPDGRYYAGTLDCAIAGTVILEIVSPRPLRLWHNGTLLLDEGLFWRWYEREVRATVLAPCTKGASSLLVEVGPRPTWPDFVEHDCPSRNRESVRHALLERHPDRLQMHAHVESVAAPALSLRYLPSQYHEDGVTWQLVRMRQSPDFPSQAPSTEHWSPAETGAGLVSLCSGVLPGDARDATPKAERACGYQRMYVPVANPMDQPAPLRDLDAPETRAEPSIEIARTLPLTVTGPTGRLTLAMPAFES